MAGTTLSKRIHFIITSFSRPSIFSKGFGIGMSCGLFESYHMLHSSFNSTIDL